MTRMSHSRLITASLPTSRPCTSSASRSSVAPSTVRRTVRTWTTGGRPSRRRRALGCSRRSPPQTSSRERAVAAVAQDGVVVGLLLVREVGDQRVLGRTAGLDAVAGAVRDEGEVAGLQLEAVAVDDQLAATRGDGVEPHATRHRRHRSAPRLAEVRRAVEDAGDRDVAQRVGDGRHGDGVGDHAHHVASAAAETPRVVDDQHRIADGQPWKRPVRMLDAGRHDHHHLDPDRRTDAAPSFHPDPATIRRAIERRSVATLATVVGRGRPHAATVLYQCVDDALFVSTSRQPQGPQHRRARRRRRDHRRAAPARRSAGQHPVPVDGGRSRQRRSRDRPPRRRRAARPDHRATASWTSTGGCFLRIPLPARLVTYALGMSLWHVLRHPLDAAGEVELH